MNAFQTAAQAYAKNPSQETLQQQVASLVGQMTLGEKQTMITGRAMPGFIFQVLRDKLFKGSYVATPFRGSSCRRLGIPEVVFSDGPRGVVAYHSTCFPVSMLRASTFDDELEYRVGRVIARELNAQGANYFGGVCINLVRNPRWGRSQESYGEDPYLLGRMGSALVRAVQEDGIIACVKHFALNSVEDLRFWVDARADERTLQEVYLPHFKKCIEAGALSVMSAYNQVNGEYCAENHHLLTDILRDDWGFDGFVMSDFMYGVHDQAGALHAGLDLEMPVPNYYAKLKQGLNTGSITLAQIDRAVGRIVGVLLRSLPNLPPAQRAHLNAPEHQALAREVASKGMVLLKNSGVLPLANTARVAVVGPYATVANLGDEGSSLVIPPYAVSPVAGIQKRFAVVTKSPGTNIAAALKAAHGSDAVVVCVGNNKREEGEFLTPAKKNATVKPKNSGGDRRHLGLELDEIALIRALKNAGHRVIVAIAAGCAVLVDEWQESADAILMAYYAGMEGGNALADLLSGDICPSGKLPFTLAKKEADYPKFIEFDDLSYRIEYGYYHGYTLFDKTNTEPAYPFGFGLSYTSFVLEDVGVEPVIEPVAEGVQVTATIRNSGQRVGAEVLQVYAGSTRTDVDRPLKLLKGFQRVELQPGEAKTVVIRVFDHDLKFFDPATKTWSLDPAYRFYVGTDSREAMSRQFEIGGT